MAAGGPGTVADEELAQRARDGRLDAFETLVRRHQTPTFRLCLRMLGNRADAEDAAQDAFLRAWRSLPGWRSEATFSTWLYRITVNRCLDLLRGRRATEALPEDLVAADGSPEQEAQARDQLRAMREAVARLTPEQRSALVLREVEGLSYQQIADVLRTTVPAVKSRLNRARVELAHRVKWPA